MAKLSLEYLYRLPKIKTEKVPPLLLLIHGYGSNEADLFSFSQNLPDEFLIISVRAPLSLGFQSYAWYTINFNATDGNFSDISEAITARDKIICFLEELQNEFTFNPNNISLFGFSQGTILSYAIALSYPDKITNVVALSGYVKKELITEIKEPLFYTNLDIFISHGSQDQVIPLEWGEKAPLFLNKIGISNCFKTYPAGHGVTPQNFHDLNHWLTKKLQK